MTTPGTPRTEQEAIEIQRELARRVRVDQPMPVPPRFVAGVDVSAGHLIDLDQAAAITLCLTPSFRLPETTRRADRASREALRGQRGDLFRSR
ncbi:endonuclease V [Solwaraspora sp. WMMA2056]|uniref:endonuclease V n=1 Tax=Solwaraspora sp. WMMA2056 TaxID=3015161 RepID=UPI00259B6117|nr:endonuclease V [Solwaraspora sp. WMMA2056]WJK43724.1 endonuclease V [Solwaraspora sp. WMMA2056]